MTITPKRRAEGRALAIEALTIALKELNSVILASREVGVPCAAVLIDYPDAHGLCSIMLEAPDGSVSTIGPRPRKEQHAWQE